MWGLKKWISAVVDKLGENRTLANKNAISNEKKEGGEKSEGDSRRSKEHDTNESDNLSGTVLKELRERKRKRNSATYTRQPSSPFDSHLGGSPLTSLVSDLSRGTLSSRTSRQSSHTMLKSKSISIMAPNPLITAWWECTPTNMHTIVLNFLYDPNNSRCDLAWTILENIIKFPRENIFYAFLITLAIYIIFNEPARFLFYAVGFAYPMLKTSRMFKYRRCGEYSRQLRYWVVFGWFALVDVFLYSYMEKRPVYWTVKTVFVFYMMVPFIRGSDLIYHDFVRSFNKRLETVIDSFSCYHE
uniref:Receptor expression-enhancing protein n=1 Tax=Parascaris univalens TaxID=6257 RepID=A0A915BHI4_PARUN